jgi:Domain of unknown function (DUF6249)
MGGEYFVAVIAIIFGLAIPFSIPLTYMVLNYRKRRRLMELHHTERMAAIERGMELPPLPRELFEGSRSRRRTTSLLPGLVWFFIGVGILIALQSISDEEAMIGLVPAGIGLAYLIYYFMEGRRIEARVLEHELATQREEAKA